MWELPEIPPVWCKQMEFVDVLVAESQFILQSFNHSLPEHETMMAVHPLYLPDIVDSQRSHFGLPEDVFLFVTSFEPHSDIQRKNPAMVLEAFRRAFNQDDHVNLVIKINNPGSGNLVHPFVKQLKREFGDSKKIHIIAESLSYNEVISLYDCCDAYISLHRSEGLGLGIMEAMMLGKAVIATGWSGNMTYMNESNSCPVKYRLVPVAGSTPAYQKELIGREMVWADPDIDDVVAWMQRLVNEPSLRMELGQKAYKDMHEWHAEACKGEFADALQYLWQTRIAKENEQKAYRKWLGWRIEGWELFYEARNYRFSWKQLTEFSWPRSKARGKAVARKILHFAQKTSLGQYLIGYLYNKRIIHSLQF
jgi:glycosyltransferase involved in cell wall biosynthesis